MELNEFYVVLTLVDITHTNEYRKNNKQRNQQRNYDTFMQTIGLFTQAIPVTEPFGVKLDGIHRKSGTDFGIKHRVIEEVFNVDHNIWLWQFAVETEGVLGKDACMLINALHNTPAISGLDENCIMEPSVFATQGENKNTLIFRATAE
jgi:hypothetical protein